MPRTIHRTARRAAAARLLATSAAVALVAAGCGGGSSGAGGSSSGSSGSSGATGGTIVASIQEPERLITTFVNETQGFTIVHAVYKGLIDYDATSKQPVNVIAESITSPDQTVWTIKLKPGFTFHNGEPVDAESFVRAWNYGAYGPNAQDNAHFYDRIVGFEDLQVTDPDGDGPKPAPSPKADKLAGLKALDPQTIEVRLSQPFSGFPLMLGYNAFYPMAKACLADIEACNEKPIGDGPFQMDGAWQHNQQIKVVRYDKYAGRKASLDGITFKIYDKLDTAYLDMNGGELDLLHRVPASKFKEAYARYGDAMIREPSPEFNYLAVPYYVPEFTDRRVRQAMSMAIDRQPIIDALFDGQFTPAKSVIAPVVEGARPDACKEFCSYDPARAKALLAEAGGWPAGKKLQLWCNSGGGHDKWLQAVGDQLKKNLGMDYQLNCDLQFPQYLGKLDERQMTGPWRLRWSMDYPSPENYIKPMYTKGAPGNFSDYVNPAVDDLVHRGDLAKSLDDAIPFYQQAEDIVLQDLPLIPLWFGVTSIVRSDKIDHIVFNPSTGVEWDTITVKGR